jgi:hypothetical protein
MVVFCVLSLLARLSSFSRKKTKPKDMKMEDAERDCDVSQSKYDFIWIQRISRERQKKNSASTEKGRCREWISMEIGICTVSS